jgi:hypothetical protein
MPAPMSKFESALDEAYDDLEGRVGRAPTEDETETLRQTLFKQWMDAGRHDDLIDYIHDYHELEGGFGDCCILTEALKRNGDLARIERLYEGLLKKRLTAFWRLWPQAQAGHIGAMRGSAAHMAAAMESFGGLWHGYWALGDEAGQAAVRERMLQLQDRKVPRAGK